MAQTLVNGFEGEETYKVYTKDNFPSIHADLTIIRRSADGWNRLREELGELKANIFYNPSTNSFNVFKH